MTQLHEFLPTSHQDIWIGLKLSYEKWAETELQNMQ